MKTKILCIAVALVLIAGIPATASTSLDLSKVSQKKTVDLRSDKSPSAWRMVVFLARDGKPGHAYVAALTFREDSESFVTDSIFGLYPLEEPKWVINEVPGQPDVLPHDADPDIALLVWTNPEQHAEVLAIRDRYEKEGTYQLLAKDCVSLMDDVAEALSLERPSLSFRPYSYLKALLDDNE